MECQRLLLAEQKFFIPMLNEKMNFLNQVSYIFKRDHCPHSPSLLQWPLSVLLPSSSFSALQLMTFKYLNLLVSHS